MQLPDIAIPLTLPFGVPLMLHPGVVHFAMALPVVVLALELANLLFKRRALSVTSLVLLLVTAVVYLAAYFTGKADGSEASTLLDPGAQEALKIHRILGTYLAYGLLVPLVFKLTAMLLRQKWARGALIVTLVMFISFMFKQGYDGGELVYRYGVNVKAVTEARKSAAAANETIRELNATLTERNATIGTLRQDLDACKAEKEGSIGSAVDKAITNVKKMFGDSNKTQSVPPATAEKASSAVPTDANDSNGSR